MPILNLITRDGREIRGDTDGTIILYLYPLIFEYQGIRNSIIIPSESPLVSFLFLSFLILCNFSLIIYYSIHWAACGFATPRPPDI